ncbi:hypothetical protein ES705_00804 [subsurface metagenome]
MKKKLNIILIYAIKTAIKTIFFVNFKYVKDW